MALNPIQLEFMVLRALETELGNARIVRKYGDTHIYFPMDNGTQQAKVTVSYENLVFCVGCGKEILDAGYNQTRHEMDECQKPQTPVVKGDDDQLHREQTLATKHDNVREGDNKTQQLCGERLPSLTK